MKCSKDTRKNRKKNYPINEQQLVKTDKLYDEIWKFDESIKSLKTLLAKSSGEYRREEIESIEATKKNSRLQAELECKQDLIMQEGSETSELFFRFVCMIRD